MKPNNDDSPALHQGQFGEGDNLPMDDVAGQPRLDGKRPSLPDDQGHKEPQRVDEHSKTPGPPGQSLFAEGTEFFTDQHNQAFVTVTVDEPAPHLECWPVKSQAFRDCLTIQEAARTGDLPKPSHITARLKLAQAIARRGPRREVANRFAGDATRVYIDLADPSWRVIEITPTGWRMIDNAPLRFQRFSHQMAIEPPPHTGDATQLSDFMPRMNDGDQLLITVIAALVPVASIPRPILILCGPEGTGKTGGARRIRTLFDPSSLVDLGETARKQLALSLNQHAVPIFENLGELRPSEVDMMCRVTTGSGRSRRALYTDSEVVIETFRRPLILTGVNHPTTRPELLSRAVMVDVLPMDDRKTEAELNTAFTASLPSIRAGMLNLLVEAMRALKSAPSDAEFRMADFAMWGRAICLALGRREDDFVEAYRAAIERQDVASVEASELATVVELFAKPEPWRGTTTDLLNQLTAIALRRYAGRRPRDWPGGANILTRRLKEIQQTLGRVGVHAVYSVARRGWEIWRDP